MYEFVIVNDARIKLKATSLTARQRNAAKGQLQTSGLERGLVQLLDVVSRARFIDVHPAVYEQRGDACRVLNSPLCQPPQPACFTRMYHSTSRRT